MCLLRVLSGWIWVAGLLWFIPAAWTLFFQDQMGSVDAWHRMVAGCIFFLVAGLVNIYEKLSQIADKLAPEDSDDEETPREADSDEEKTASDEEEDKVAERLEELRQQQVELLEREVKAQKRQVEAAERLAKLREQQVETLERQVEEKEERAEQQTEAIQSEAGRLRNLLVVPPRNDEKSEPQP